MTATYENELYILLLAWTTLQMTLPQKIAMERFNSHYHKFTKAALKENVFVLMYEISSDSILKVIYLLLYIKLKKKLLIMSKFSEFQHFPGHTKKSLQLIRLRLRKIRS